LAIDAPNAPGYLREAVYHEYKLTSWSGHSTTIQHLGPDETRTETDTIINDLQTFALGSVESSNNTQSWRVKTLNRFFLTVLCLPGNVTSLMLPEGTKPSINADGMVTLEQSALPPSYWISVDKTKENQAFPLPEKDNFSDYLQIPANLVSSVSNWVQNCQTFAMSESVADGILALENYFHANYTYKLGIQPERGKHPLDNFMQTREGHCTLFASAAALMLRQKNIPSRMVSGYLCQEKHPLTAQWIVRERNTHAWCEAWDQSAKKWRLVEVTPPGNLPTGFPEPMLSRLLWEYLKNQGDRFFTYLRTNNPLIALINYIVIGAILIWQFVNSAFGIAIIISTIILALTLVWHRKYKNKAVLDERVRLREALKQAMFLTEKRVIPFHLRRESHESWSSWWQRIRLEIPSDTATRFDSLLEEYQALRYQAVLDIDGTKKWLDKCKRMITATR
jgi:hypothetical protein